MSRVKELTTPGWQWCYDGEKSVSREWGGRVEQHMLLRRHDETNSCCSIWANGIILSLIVLSAKKQFSQKVWESTYDLSLSAL